ncbi:unnamed protein product [Urochloa humidicola]
MEHDGGAVVAGSRGRRTVAGLMPWGRRTTTQHGHGEVGGAKTMAHVRRSEGAKGGSAAAGEDHQQQQHAHRAPCERWRQAGSSSAHGEGPDWREQNGKRADKDGG